MENREKATGTDSAMDWRRKPNINAINYCMQQRKAVGRLKASRIAQREKSSDCQPPPVVYCLVYNVLNTLDTTGSFITNML